MFKMLKSAGKRVFIVVYNYLLDSKPAFYKTFRFAAESFNKQRKRNKLITWATCLDN